MIGMVVLQGVAEELVHLGQLGGHAEVDRPVADLDDQPALDVRVDLVGHLELLALADVRGLGYGGLESGEGLVVQLLESTSVSHNALFPAAGRAASHFQPSNSHQSPNTPNVPAHS